MITLAEVKDILLNQLLENGIAVKRIAIALNENDQYPYGITSYGDLSIVEFIYICYILNFNFENFLTDNEKLNLLYDKANKNIKPVQIDIDMLNKQNFSNNNVINSITKKENVTPTEFELLKVFRKLGQKYGTKTQYLCISIAEKLLKNPTIAP